MRILFLTNYYPPFEKGGYEQLCRDVAVLLHEKKHVVEVLTSDIGADIGTSTEFAVHRLLRISPQFDSSSNVALQFFFSRNRDEAFDLRCLRETVANFNPDVIFIWNLQGLPRALASQAEALPEITVAYWLAGYSPAEPDEFWEYWSSPGKSRPAKLLKQFLSAEALKKLRKEGKPIRPHMHHTAVVSEFMRQKGIRAGTLPHNTDVIYNGVEIEDYFQPVRYGEGSPKLLQAGRLSHNKGAHVSIKALGKLVNEYRVRQIHLTLAGSGQPSEISQLEDLVDHLELSSYVTFLGWVPRERMAEIMHNHHILLLPTIHQEAFARVVLEAMAAGLTVIAANTGGTSELVQHERTGLLCPPDNETILANEIQRLVQTPQMRLDLARRGQYRVIEEFTLKSMVDNLESFLYNALGKRTLV